MLPASRLHMFKVAAAAALLTGGNSSMFAAADCEDIKALPTSTMTQDVRLFLDDLDSLSCDEVTTIKVDGPYNYVIASDDSSETFRKVRFDISGGAKFSISLASEEFDGTATFTGNGSRVTDAISVLFGKPVPVAPFSFLCGQSTDGGVFNVERGSSATFEVPVAFESNSVNRPYSGGAVYAAGKVVFQYDASFTGNTVKDDGDSRAHEGGGLCVAPTGDVSFEGSSSFVENVAESGGSGSAVANFGDLVFKGTSFYESNHARENGDETGGLGGAVFTEKGSNTLFEGRAIMQFNIGSSGGALYNRGTTDLRNGAFFRGNKAQGTDSADGGHICTSGILSARQYVNFAEGSTRIDGGAVYVKAGSLYSPSDETTFIDNSAGEDGGAVYIERGGFYSPNGETTFTDNSAEEQGGAVYVQAGGFYSPSGDTTFIDNSAEDCPNVYASGNDPVCLETKNEVALQ